MYAIGEIILLVIGILLALQFNNLNDKKQLKKEKLQLYRQVRNQVSEDYEEIKGVKALNHYYGKQFEKAVGIISLNDRSKTDSLALLAMQLSQYSDFNGSGNIYNTLVHSGDIKLINSVALSNKLQGLEMTYAYVNKLEDIHWEIIMKELSPELKGVIRYADLRVVKPEKLYSVELQNIFIESVFLTRGKDSIYSRALHEIDGIVDLIDNELNP